MDFCPRTLTFAADPGVVGSAVGSAAVEHLHKYQWLGLPVNRLSNLGSRLFYTHCVGSYHDDYLNSGGNQCILVGQESKSLAIDKALPTTLIKVGLEV